MAELKAPPAPFVSEAQRAKWQSLVKEGKITPEQFAARERATPATIPPRAPARDRTTGASRGFDKAAFGTGQGFTGEAPHADKPRNT